MTNHKLIIRCYDDAVAECSCGTWYYTTPNARTKKEIIKIFLEHKKWAKYEEKLLAIRLFVGRFVPLRDGMASIMQIKNGMVLLAGERKLITERHARVAILTHGKGY